MHALNTHYSMLICTGPYSYITSDAEGRREKGLSDSGMAWNRNPE